MREALIQSNATGYLALLLVGLTTLISVMMCVLSSLTLHLRYARLDRIRGLMLASNSQRHRPSVFRAAFGRADEACKRRLCRDLLLDWIRTADPNISRAEQPAAPGSSRDARQSINPKDLLIACQQLRALDYSARRRFVEQATRVAVADRRLSDAKNYLLRFLADVADIDLDRVYRAATGGSLPLPGDASSIRWWLERETIDQRRREDVKSQRKKEKSPQANMSRNDALQVLGVSKLATDSEIRRAYRLGASLYHPDRFVDASAERERAAALTFKRINEAYQRLTRR